MGRRLKAENERGPPPTNADLPPLADAKSHKVLIRPPNAKDIEFLRASTQLKRISFKEDKETHHPDKTAAEFWKEWDAKKK